MVRTGVFTYRGDVDGECGARIHSAVIRTDTFSGGQAAPLGTNADAASGVVSRARL